jgi:hypothetical protein
LGQFSLVTLLAHPLFSGTVPPLRQSAWYHKTSATFADALAFVRRQVWASLLFQPSLLTQDGEQIPPTLLNHRCDLLCYAA